jgi:hypothetical protein
MPENHFTEPTTSIWPIILAAGIALIVTGLLFSLFLSLVGVILVIFALAGWTQEVRTLAPFMEQPEDGEETGHE